MMKEILLITGASGFIGQHLMPRLQENYHVVALQSDLRDHAAVREEIRHHDPQLVVHLAARTEVQMSFYEPNVFADINFTGTVNLIECCVQECKRLRGFIFASTMEVYGWQPISDEVRDHGSPVVSVVFDETTETHPSAPYAVAKRGCELYLEYAHRSMGFPFVAIRQTNSYGRTDNDFFVTEQIITQMLKDPDKIYLGYAEPYRNFIHVDDLVDAWLTVIDNAAGLSGKIYTIGPNNPIKIRDYAYKIAGMIGWHGEIIWDSKPPRVGEIYWLNSSNDRITADTGWKPRISLDEGLQRTIDVWKKNLSSSA
jgi:nucleoside-diphosphate-sugar epimerase